MFFISNEKTTQQPTPTQLKLPPKQTEAAAQFHSSQVTLMDYGKAIMLAYKTEPNEADDQEMFDLKIILFLGTYPVSFFCTKTVILANLK